MTDKIPGLNEAIPKWDVALEALARNEYQQKGAALRIDDFTRLSKDHVIRFDDIMVTLFELVLQGEWRYEDDERVIKILTRDEVNHLYVNGRLSDNDVRDYTGYWSPTHR